MSKERKEWIVSFGTIILFWVVMGCAVWYSMSSECWYANMHDSNCEMNGHCGCYNRFVEANK